MFTSSAGKPDDSSAIRPPLLSVSLDLDNLWSYLKTNGNAQWATLPSYLDRLVEILLPWLNAHDLKITVFVVGQDAALDANRRPLQALADAGHEIGNHSFHHDPWLQRLTDAELSNEVARAEDRIGEATGRRPVGFRAPGFSYTERLALILARRNYVYDASTWPTFVGPLARLYYLRRTAPLTAGERETRGQLFGGAREGLRANRTHLRLVGGIPLVEIPVTTLPVLRLPLHMTYIGYLAEFSERLAMGYLRHGLRVCRSLDMTPSFLLHPPDFMGSDLVPELSFFPSMRATTERKLKLLDDVVREIKAQFMPVTMIDHAEAFLNRSGVPSTVAATGEPTPATVKRGVQ